ncbi:MAG: Eco57I restriction-modification methylase domain-containing protein [Armatimonadota bacterium]|nr:Eco57I restriction-modification methylase domain-containing protein [Armatimonadota bacterium]
MLKPERLDQERFRAKLQQLVQDFEAAYNANPSINHDTVHHQFVDRLLDILGWPLDASSYRLSHRLPDDAGIPDGILHYGANPICAIEVKRPEEPASHQIPDIREGSAYDSRQLAHGLREKLRYVMYQGAARWLILVSMKHLHVFDSQTKRWVIAFNSTAEMVKHWERLLLLSFYSVTEEQSLDRLARNYSTRPVESLIESLNHWRLELAHSVWTLNQTFEDISLELVQAAVRRMLDRLIIIQIIDDKGLIAGHAGLLDGQIDQWERERDDSIGGLRSFRDRLGNVFQTFNTLYNSTIFEPDVTDDLAYGDEALVSVASGIAGTGFRHLDARIIGTAYERYAGYRLELAGEGLQRRIDPRFRQSTGTFYTPDYIVKYVVGRTVGRALEGKTLEDIQDFRVVDKACGSGSFLIGAFDELARFYESERQRLEKASWETADPKELERIASTLRLAGDYPRKILEQHLYGVDLNPEAAEFATVSLIVHALSYEKDKGRDPEELHLPLILNQNIKVGNSLVSALDTMSAEEREAWLSSHAGRLAKIREMRDGLRRIVDPDEKQRMIEEIKDLTDELNWGTDGLNHRLADAFGGVENAREERPFNWEVEFPEVFDPGTAPKRRGFDCDIGNPPYVNIRRMRDYDARQTDYLTAAPVFASSGSYDVYVLFLERSLQLSRTSAGFIVSRKFFYQDYGEAVRRLMGEGNHLRELVDFSHLQVFQESDATTYTCVAIVDKSPVGAEVRLARLTRLDKQGTQMERIRVAGGVGDEGVRADTVPAARFGAEPWVPCFEDERAVMRRMEEQSMPLGVGGVGAHIFVGIQTSADDIYILDYRGEEGDCYIVRAQASELKRGDRLLWSRPERTVRIEKALLKPLLSGQDVQAYGTPELRQLLLFPYELLALSDQEGNSAQLIPAGELAERFPHASDYLLDCELRLRAREGGKFDDDRWYRMGRSQNLGIQGGRKLVVPSLVQHFRAMDDASGAWYLDNVNAIGVRFPADRDAYLRYLVLLNSGCVDWYLHVISTPFRGGFYQPNGQFLERIPIPCALANPDGGTLGPAEFVSRAEQLQRLTAQMRALSADFRRFVGHLPMDRTLDDILKKVSVRNRSLVSGQKRPDHSIRGAGVRRDGEWLVLWAALRDPDAEEDYQADIYRFRIGEPVASLLERFLPTLGPSDFSKSRKQSVLDRIKVCRIPSGRDDEIGQAVEAYDREKARADELDAEIAAGRDAVDETCYHLYGLQDADREVMRRSGG